MCLQNQAFEMEKSLVKRGSVQHQIISQLRQNRSTGEKVGINEENQKLLASLGGSFEIIYHLLDSLDYGLFLFVTVKLEL